MTLKYMNGDLIALAQAGQFDVIAHGCNCFCTMGKGIAKTIRETFPAAWEADQSTERESRSKLGSCSMATIALPRHQLVVVNAYTQYDYFGRQPVKQDVWVDVDAVESCMYWIRDWFSGLRIGMPMIGAGLGGGDWPTIAAAIDRVLGYEDVTIVKFQPARTQKGESMTTI